MADALMSALRGGGGGQGPGPGGMMAPPEQVPPPENKPADPVEEAIAAVQQVLARPDVDENAKAVLQRGVNAMRGTPEENQPPEGESKGKRVSFDQPSIGKPIDMGAITM